MLALGDMTQQILSRLGVTEQRVRAVTGASDCGCQKRKEKMNEWGFELQGRLSLILFWWRFSVCRPLWHRFKMSGRFFWMACRALVLGRP